MAYQIKNIDELKGKRKGLDVTVDLGFRQKTLYFESEKVFKAEFARRMAQAELHVQYDLDQEAYDRAHPTFYSREDLHDLLVMRGQILPAQTNEDIPTKSEVWLRMKDYSTSETLAIWNKIFGTSLGQPTTEVR